MQDTNKKSSRNKKWGLSLVRAGIWRINDNLLVVGVAVGMDFIELATRAMLLLPENGE